MIDNKDQDLENTILEFLAVLNKDAIKKKSI